MSPAAPRSANRAAGDPTDWSARDSSILPGRGGGAGAGGRSRRMFTPLRIGLALLLVVLGWFGWSYGHALAAPGNDPVGIRTTEWLKDHHFTWAVNDIERFWYNHHKPKKGGAPTGALRSELQAAAAAAAPPQPPAPAKTSPTTAPVVVTPHLPAPAPIAPIVVGSPLAGEGHWLPMGLPVKGLPAVYSAFLRPDTVHTSLLTAVAWMDPTLLKAVGYAGVQEPGGGPWTNQAPIPAAVRPDLVAAFNSGFKMRDARGGYYADGKVVKELRVGAATLVISPDGTPTIGQWGRDFQLGPSVAFARQNLSLIVDNSQPAPTLATDSNYLWGATLGNEVLVWRSGIGVTANGALIYVAGKGLSATSLAGVLVRAGAVRAMELDINSQWVDFFTFGPAPAGQPAGELAVTKLIPEMRPPLNNYFTSSSRDFIAIFARAQPVRVDRP